MKTASHPTRLFRSDRILRWLLAIVGCGLLLATIPVFFPVSWMATIHQWLGLGKFPEGPVIIYLARSTSMLYAVHGALMLIVSFNLHRYRPLVPVFGWMHVFIGITTFITDLTTPMPWYWTAIEGVPVALTGLAILLLFRFSGNGEPA